MAEDLKHVDTTQVNHDPEQASSLFGDDVPYRWYRGVFFQATVVGLCAFAAPGLWNAMQSVGAGGAQTPYLVM